MRHARIIACFTILIVISILAANPHDSRAQDATATPEIINRTFENLGLVTDLSLAPGMALQLERYTWLPGVVTAMHTHPAEIDILYIQSGEIAWSVENGEAQITRAAQDGQPGTDGDTRARHGRDTTCGRHRRLRLHQRACSIRAAWSARRRR